MSAVGKVEDPPLALGKYELVTPIGRGGMAEVHLAVQRGPAGFEKLVVVKLVHEHLATQKLFVEMLLDEAKLAAQLKHPNIVDIYELGEHDGRYFIAMEYLEGEPLLELLRVGGLGQRLDPLSTARLIADTAEGLDAAHRLKARDGTPLELVHHDVSLGNIVVLYSGLVKLVDFGVAKAAQGASVGATVQGKLGYMAPEKLSDGAVDRRSDIWSLGCVLWEALTLKRLFRAPTDAETVRLVREIAIEAPSKIDPSVPADLDPIVARALQRDPDKRYQTAKALANDLEEVLREHKYGARNDRIAQHMEVAFADRILARARVLQDVSSKRRPTTDILERAFAEPGAPTRTISSTGNAPVAEPSEPAAPAPIVDRPSGAAHEASPAPKLVEDRPSAGARSKRGSIAPTSFMIRPAPVATPDPEPLSAMIQPPPSVPPGPPLRPSAAILPPIPSGPPAPLLPSAPVLPSTVPPARPEPNPFDDDDSGKTVADDIPSFPDASRSLRNDPSWAVSRHGSSLGQLQHWVQESRENPASRWRLLARRITAGARRLERKWTSVARRRKLPRWLPLPIAGVVLVIFVVAIARCGGGAHDPAPTSTSAMPAAPAPAAATTPEVHVQPPPVPAPPPPPSGGATPTPPAGSGSAQSPDEIEMTAVPVRPRVRPTGNAPALYTEGLEALRKGDARAALASLTRAQQVDPSYAPTWYGLGLVYERLGKRAAAKASYRRYLVLSPRAANAAQIRALLDRL